VESEGFDEGALRESLSARLPNGSIPRRFVRHERLPRNPNGKVDRAAAARLPVGRPDEEPRSLASPDAPATIDIVLRAWGTALARTDIGADTDFFAIGGDSLSAVEVVTAIGERLDQLVPIATLLTGRTPEGMTELLDRAEVADVAPAHLPSPAFQAVTLQPGAAGGPLILMTPAWDDVFGYQALAAAFPDACTVVALAYVEQADEPVVTTVDELVREFLPQAMNEIDVRSTVAVVGWSVGGVVAVELTERLSAAGRPVELVALIDTFFPGEERHLWSNRWSKYKSLLRPGSFGEARRELRVMTVRRVKRLAERLGRRLLIWSGATLPKEPERTSVGGFPVQALAHDVEKLHTPLVFYRASTTNPERTLVKWRTVADEVVDVEIPGRHRGYNSIMGAKGVGLIASDLVGRLPVERD
jgi:thioesterase domain-containing protein/acyl carrier protein